MKRLIPLIFLLMLSSCAGKTPKPPAITAADPILMASGAVQLPDGRTAEVSLEMTEGEYFQAGPDRSPYRSNFCGRYRLRAEFSDGAAAELPIAFDSETLTFDAPFTLLFGDYNGDGQPDFTIGQYASLSNSLYQFYTLTADSSLALLPFRDGIPMVLSMDFSIAPEVRQGKLILPVWDSEKGAAELSCSWDGEAFVRDK